MSDENHIPHFNSVNIGFYEKVALAKLKGLKWSPASGENFEAQMTGTAQDIIGVNILLEKLAEGGFVSKPSQPVGEDGKVTLSRQDLAAMGIAPEKAAAAAR